MKREAPEEWLKALSALETGTQEATGTQEREKSEDLRYLEKRADPMRYALNQEAG